MTDRPDFDFSILHLASPVEFNDKVQPACLPDETFDENFLAGKNLTVSGWGYPYPKVLHKATYPAHTNEDCIRYNGGKDACVTNNTLCAGNPDDRQASSSNSDSGGKLFKKKEN